ncbi:MAG: sulfatase-like hydrolase/transferase, partial [Acidobacteria bacterium]|nr:sulfatase-like hydrolase/transferase [Acidobacteriota bacterium]
MNRRSALMTGLGAAASLGGASAQQPLPELRRQRGARPRNVIFILVDDHRYDAMGFLKGQPWLETPVLDSLARDGAYFKNAFVTTALCSPSRASIL